MPAGDPISMGIGAAAGAAQLITGLIAANKSKKIAAELEKNRPKYQISDTAGQDLDLAESELANGMSSRAETAYNNLNNQQFSSSLSAILRGGGSVNNVAETYGANEEGRQRLALLNDQIRMQQIDRLMKTRSMYRDEEDKEWQINDYAPWADKKEANAEARKNAQNQIWSGVGTIANAGINYFSGKNQEKVFDKYFGGKEKWGSGQNDSFNPKSVSTQYVDYKRPGVNSNPNDVGDFVMPDYLMDENWMLPTSVHNMY